MAMAELHVDGSGTIQMVLRLRGVQVMMGCRQCMGQDMLAQVQGQQSGPAAAAAIANSDAGATTPTVATKFTGQDAACGGNWHAGHVVCSLFFLVLNLCHVSYSL